MTWGGWSRWLEVLVVAADLVRVETPSLAGFPEAATDCFSNFPRLCLGDPGEEGWDLELVAEEELFP